MATWLRQSTAVDVMIGPELDSIDGNSVEGGLTITQSDIRLSKNGGAFAQKSAAQTLVHAENGWYPANLSTTDTNTLGSLLIAVHESGALAAWREFMIVNQQAWDSLFGSDVLQVDMTQLLGDGQSATDLKDFVDAGYDPATNKVQGVVLVDSVTDLADNAIDAATLASDTITAAKVADGTIDAATFAANAITDAAVATDMDQYAAKVWVIKEGTTADHYAVAFYKNGQRVTSGITSPTIQVIKGSDGTDLIASTALTEIGSTHRFKKDESTNKLVAGQIYFAVVSATIDGSSRNWDQQIGRDSA